MSPGLCLVLIPIGFLAGVLSMDSSSAVVRPLFCVGVCFPGAGAWLRKACSRISSRVLKSALNVSTVQAHLTWPWHSTSSKIPASATV